jgi:hypothetical protein
VGGRVGGSVGGSVCVCWEEGEGKGEEGDRIIQTTDDNNNKKRKQNGTSLTTTTVQAESRVRLWLNEQEARRPPTSINKL